MISGHREEHQLSTLMRVVRLLSFSSVFLAVLISSADAYGAFGFNSLETTALKRDGTLEMRAGAHPYEYEISFNMNQDSEGSPEGTLSELVVDLPPGLIGNPLAIPRCSGADFEGQTPQCPGETQIGVAHVEIRGQLLHEAVYNLVPPPGVVASFGLSVAGNNSFQEASLRTGGDYGATVSDIAVPTVNEILSVTETIWGVPADSGHDPERVCSFLQPDGSPEQIVGCESEIPDAPFLSLPTSCTGPLVTTLKVSSVEEPDAVVEGSVASLGPSGEPEGLNSCEKPPFSPTIEAQPETTASDSATGLHFGLTVPQNEDPSDNAVATAHLKDTTVTLPKGVAVNASSADGLGACSPAQIDLKGSGPAQCPASSKVGTVIAETPALDHPVPGTVYIAKQGDNPFGSLIALYIALHDPISGVIVKLAGKVEPDPVTGQLRTSFKDNPQLPVESFEFDFFGGPRASLTTPPTCGTYTTTADLTPWTSPEGKDVLRTDSFSVTTSPGGGPCAQTEAQMPHVPSFEAGTAAPLAGAYSPFVLRLSRENGSQRFGGLNLTLPQGVTAKLAGVPECSEAQITQAQARANPGEGALEQASPSCPPASEVGTVNVGAGSGNPFFVQGHAYLAGPYKGAPISIAVITPAVAGPFDLGTVVVRTPAYVNEETGQVTVKSDPLPTILQGIPLDVRTIVIKIDRAAYILNPTSCDQLLVSGEAISTTGAVAPLSNRFQVGGCKGLDYTPKLALSMKGATRRSGHPALKAVLTQPSGQANTRRAVVILPPTEFIDQNHIANPCTRPQFAQGKCPPASVLGKARVFTPLLDKPLEGRLYFRANGGARDLPDVVADLNGQVHFVLVGFVDAVTKKGSESSRVRTTFATAPDAPVSKAIFEFKGGKQGVLVNSANLCKVPNIATVKMTAHNNKAHDFDKKIATSCPKKKR
jgi:hypothetical protein